MIFIVGDCDTDISDLPIDTLTHILGYTSAEVIPYREALSTYKSLRPYEEGGVEDAVAVVVDSQVWSNTESIINYWFRNCPRVEWIWFLFVFPTKRERTQALRALKKDANNMLAYKRTFTNTQNLIFGLSVMQYRRVGSVVVNDITII